MFNILGRRYLFFGLSLLLILPGLLLALIYGLNLSVDFTGGTLVEISFSSGTTPPPEKIVEVYNQYGISDVQVQTTGDNTIIARSTFLEDGTRADILTAVEEKENDTVTIIRIDSVGATIGREVALRAALAVAVAAIIVVVYITFVFRGMPNAFRNGICAIIAELHDVLVIFSLVIIGSIFWGWQLDALFLTALLTVIGFSVQDTIVVFDRIRENRGKLSILTSEMISASINQTLSRTLLTSFTTFMVVLVMYIWGGAGLRGFTFAMLAGIIVGTYSSIAIAAPILLLGQSKSSKK